MTTRILSRLECPHLWALAFSRFSFFLVHPWRGVLDRSGRTGKQPERTWDFPLLTTVEPERSFLELTRPWEASTWIQKSKTGMKTPTM
jgi:hypothetical protein